MLRKPRESGAQPEFHREAARERRTHWTERAFFWLLAPLDSQKEGLSLTRLMAVTILSMTFHLAHDWIDKATKEAVPLGWAFASFVTAGFLLAVVTALGGKYVLAFMQSKFNPTPEAPHDPQV